MDAVSQKVGFGPAQFMTKFLQAFDPHAALILRLRG